MQRVNFAKFQGLAAHGRRRRVRLQDLALDDGRGVGVRGGGVEAPLRHTVPAAAESGAGGAAAPPGLSRRQRVCRRQVGRLYGHI